MERTLPGLALAAFWILLLLKGSFLLFWAVILVAAVIGAMEYLHMSVGTSLELGKKCVLAFFFVLPVLAAGLNSALAADAGFFAAFISLACYILYCFRSVENSFEDLARFCLGVVYIGFLLSHLVLLRGVADGAAWVLVLTAMTAGSDSGAYYCGRSFGRTKLSPNVSPKKTVEGAAGGMIVGMAISFLFARILMPKVDWLFLVPTAVVLIGVGMLGDLTESVMKRGTDTKDSGRLLGGHGGVLDRMDSMLFAAPVLYYLLVFTGRA